MATIYQRKAGGPWYIDWRESGRRHQVSLKTRDRRVAERELRRLEARLALGVTDLPSRVLSEISLQDFRKAYLDHLEARSSPAYREHVHYAFKRPEKEFDNPRLSRLTTRELEEQVTRLALIYAPATVNGHIKCLRAAFNRAVQWGHLRRNPLTGVSLLKDPAKDHKVEFLSEKELERLFEKTRGTLLHDVFVTLYYTGIRRGELVHLWWEDVDFEQGLLHIRVKEWTDEEGRRHQWFPKARRERTIPLHKKLRPILHSQPRRGRFVFTSRRGGPVLSTLRPMIQRFQEQTGWRVYPHLLRHTFASHLVQRGVSLYVVGELLGHSGPEITKIYAHLVPKQLGSVVGLLGTNRKFDLLAGGA